MSTPKRQSSRLRALKGEQTPNTSMGSPLSVLLERETTPQKHTVSSLSEVMFSPALNVLNNGGVRTPPGQGSIKPPAEEMDPKKSQKRVIQDESLTFGFQNIDDSRLRNSPSPVKRRTSPSKLPQRSFKTMLKGMLSPRKSVATPVSFTITSPFLVKSKDPEPRHTETTESSPPKNVGAVPLRGLGEEAQKLLANARADYAKMLAQNEKEEAETQEKPSGDNHANTTEKLHTRKSEEIRTGVTVRRIAKPTTRKGRYSGVHTAQFDKMDSIANHASAWRAKRQTEDLAKPKTSLKRTLSKAEIADPKAGRGSHAFVKAVKRDGAQDVAADRPKIASTDGSTDEPRKPAEKLCKTPPPSPKKTEIPTSPSKSSVKPASGIKLATPTSPSKRPIQTPQIFAKPSLNSLLKPTASSLARTSSVSSLKGSSIPVSKTSPSKPPATPQHASTTLLKPPSVSLSGTVRSILRRPYLTETMKSLSTSPTPSKKNVNFSPETHFGPRNPVMPPRKIKKPRPPSAKLIEINKTFGRVDAGAEASTITSDKPSYPNLSEDPKEEVLATATTDIDRGEPATDGLRMPGSFEDMDEDDSAGVSAINEPALTLTLSKEKDEDLEESDIHKELEKLRRSINGEQDLPTSTSNGAVDTKKRKRDENDSGEHSSSGGTKSPLREAVDPLSFRLYPDLGTEEHDLPVKQKLQDQHSEARKGINEQRPSKLQKRVHQLPSSSNETAMSSPNKSSTGRYLRTATHSAHPGSRLMKNNNTSSASRFSKGSSGAGGGSNNRNTGSRLLRF